MRAIPLPLLTLYADLEQSLDEWGIRPGSISRRRSSGAVHLYSTEKDGAERRQRYLGPETDPAVREEAEAVRRSARRAKVRRSSVSALKAAGIPGPPIEIARTLEVLANAGLFENGGVLVGTAAYQLYPCVVGAFLSSGALMTQDADIGLTEIAMRGSARIDLDAVLRRADPSFRPRFHADDQLPFAFETDGGLHLDVLTTLKRNPAPASVKSLGCAAVPLPFLDFVLDGAFRVVALSNSGIAVRVPDPGRYAVHKLIVAQVRPAGIAKREKDLLQATELFEAYKLHRRFDHIEAQLAAARARGPRWRKLIDASLAALRSP